MAYSKFLVAGMAAAALTLVAGQSAPAQDFAGKTITVIVGSAPGGGMDLQARLFSKVWQKNIPGQPKMVVKNIPGAGGMKAYTHVFTKAKPDGLTLIWGPWRPVGHVIGQTEVRFKPEDGHLLGAGGDYVASIMRTDTGAGVKSGMDVLKVNKRYAVSGSRADDVLSMMSRISLDLLGAEGKYRYVLGYRGQGKQKVALMNNEIQFLTTGLPGYRGLYEGPVINKGIAVPVWYHPVIMPNGQPEQKSSVYPKLKSFPQVYREIHGKDPEGPLWETYKWMLNVVVRTPFSSFAPPNTPQPIVDMLRSAHQKTAKDPDIVLPRMRKLGLSLKWATPDELKDIISTYRTVKPEVAAELKKIVLAATKKK